MSVGCPSNDEEGSVIAIDGVCRCLKGYDLIMYLP